MRSLYNKTYPHLYSLTITFLLMVATCWSDTFTRDDFSQAIKNVAMEQGEEDLQNVEFSISAILNIQRAFKGATDIPHIASVTLHRDQRKFEALCHTDEGNITVRGSLFSQIQVPVPRETITRETLLSEDLFEWKDISDKQVNDHTVRKLDSLIGKKTRHRLQMGRPINKGQVYAPIIVQRNKHVPLIVQSSNMFIKTYGKSLDNGAVGDYVRVLNTHSKRIITGQVNERGQIIIGGDE